MLCPHCHGKGFCHHDTRLAAQVTGDIRLINLWGPCPYCHGGVAYCCEGVDRWQPDPRLVARYWEAKHRFERLRRPRREGEARRP